MGGLFSKPETPKIAPAPVAPPAPEEQATARRRRIATETQGSTVQNTILSSGGREKLGA